MQNAGVYRKGSFFYVESYSMTTVGVWVARGPVASVACENVAELGSGVLAALQASCTGIPHPGRDEWKQIGAPLLEAAKVKSWAAFERGTRSVGVTLEGSVVRIVPRRNLGSKGGFQPIEGACVEIPADSAAETVGQAVVRAMALAK
ncbi:MAG: hypothetical protein ACREQE_11995 [Candidatus Binataceae bacterium]